MKIKKIILIVFIIIWLIIIFCFSAQNSSKSLNMSDQLIIKTAEIIKHRHLKPQEKTEIVQKYVLIVRKSAHFCSYFILGILTYLISKELFGLNKKTIFISVIFCMLYACTDEFHQYFVSGRSASIIDVMIDTCGALLSTTILYIVHKYINKRKGIINN